LGHNIRNDLNDDGEVKWTGKYWLEHVICAQVMWKKLFLELTVLHLTQHIYGVDKVKLK